MLQIAVSLFHGFRFKSLNKELHKPLFCKGSIQTKYSTEKGMRPQCYAEQNSHDK